MIYTVAKGFFGYDNIEIPKGDFAMPRVFPLDPQNKPEIITLPTYDLNEGVMSELIQILNKIQSHIGLTPEQVK